MKAVLLYLAASILALVGAVRGSDIVLTNSDPVALAAAVQQGGSIKLAFDGIVSLTNALVVVSDTTVDATGHNVRLDGGGAVRHFVVTNAVTLRLVNLMLSNGHFAGKDGNANQAGELAQGGSILNAGGTLELVGCGFANNSARGGNAGPNLTGGIAVGPSGAPAYGGAIYSANGAVSASQCIFSNSICIGGNATLGPVGSVSGGGGDAIGGAIYATNSGVNLEGVMFTNNVVQGGQFGGASVSGGGGSGVGGALAVVLASASPTNAITRCIFSGNSALAATKTTADISRTDAYGGALYLGTGSMRIEEALFTNNLALGGPGEDEAGYAYYGNGMGGAVYNAGNLDIQNSAVVSNQANGGSLPEGCCQLWSPVGGNGSGGAVYNYNILSMINCTLAGNSVKGGTSAGRGSPGSGDGGAIFNEGATILLNVTVAANSALPAAPWQLPVQVRGGSLCVPAGSIIITNTILYSLAGETNVAGLLSDGGHNISSDGSALFTSPTSKNNADPLLGPLADNGGFTPTMALLPGSPALDTGDDSVAPAADQRGVGRPCGPHSDMGALEQIVSEPLRFTSSPANLTLSVGQTASFSALVNNLAAFQWQFQGTALAGATNPLLVLPDVQMSQAGDYSVVAATASGSITSAPAKLTVLAAAPPVIVSQPQSLAVPEGQPASFSVTATNLLALSYQWQHNGTNLPGATGPVLSLLSVASEDRGTYTVVVSTKYDSVASDPAVLTVLLPLHPWILMQPADINVTEGGTATIAVVAQGGEPLVYQWSFEGIELPGASGPILTLPNVSVLQAGNYSVTVSNALGQVTSRTAVLNVRPSLLDPGFVPPAGDASLMAVQSDGRCILSAWGKGLSRLNLDGSVDNSFVWPFPNVFEALVRPDSRIVALVQDQNGWDLVQVNQDGSVDPAFDASWTHSLSPYQPMDPGLQQDGKLVYVATTDFAHYFLVRVNQDGTRDTAFAPPDVGAIKGLLIQPDDKLVLSLGADQDNLVRMYPQGALESGFNLTLGGSGEADSLALQQDGKVIIGGYFAGVNGTPLTNLARVNTDDSLDKTFAPTLAIQASALALDDVGMLYVGGSYYSNVPNGLVRLMADGSLDPSFQVDTGGGSVLSTVNTDDGHLIISGSFTQIDGILRSGLARLNIPTAVPRILNWMRLGTMVRLSILTLPGSSYTLERADSINAANWSAVDTTVGDGSTRVLEDRNATASSAFYRVRRF